MVKVLRGGEFVLAGGLLGIQADILPERFGGAQAVGVEAHAGAGASGVRASVAEVQRGRAVHVAGLNEYRRVERAAFVRQLQQVAGLHAQAVRGGRTEERGVVPGELGDGLGQFLQPAVIGEAAIVNRGVGAEDDFQLAAQFLGPGART